ncbi:uncharacterized protein LOC122144960 [Cyprinus carpio]|uniref:Uncharacterized protein LOC122144960 n=1 Tax=Cyprinus carpio TaxID=7962 RepID=A0A9Q9Y208_CYPCA|nr:uncharacterized protein LOC122144960 [Cyprinus carpio]
MLQLQYLQSLLPNSFESAGHVFLAPRGYCKHLQITENNPQFLAGFLSLMVEISPESEDFLRNVFTYHRRSMRHARKAQLILLAFEKDLTRKCQHEWKDKVLRRFHSETRLTIEIAKTCEQLGGNVIRTQRIMERSMKDPRIDRAVAVCKKVVSSFSFSWKRRRDLATAQQELNLAAHQLISESPTRWGSREKMIEWVLEQ